MDWRHGGIEEERGYEGAVGIVYRLQSMLPSISHDPSQSLIEVDHCMQFSEECPM